MNKIESISSFSDLRIQLKHIPHGDKKALHAVKEREVKLTKPLKSLGRLEKISEWLSFWQGKKIPSVNSAQACVFAGNHGIASKGVSAYPQEVTKQMVANFKSGGAAINQLCQTFDVTLKVIPITLDKPTKDFTEAPAMSESEFIECFKIGQKSIEENTDILCLGEMGIGNTTAAAALCNAIYGGNAELWTGPGTGIKLTNLQKKISLIESAVKFHKPRIKNSLEAFATFGGFELVAISGAIFEARIKRIPVLLDGFICTSAAAVLESVQKGALDHCLLSHLSMEPGHKELVAILNKSPLLDLGMRLGEGSGSVIAISLLKAAVNCHNKMSTFDEASVSNKN